METQGKGNRERWGKRKVFRYYFRGGEGKKKKKKGVGNIGRKSLVRNRGKEKKRGEKKVRRQAAGETRLALKWEEKKKKKGRQSITL